MLKGRLMPVVAFHRKACALRRNRGAAFRGTCPSPRVLWGVHLLAQPAGDLSSYPTRTRAEILEVAKVAVVLLPRIRGRWSTPLANPAGDRFVAALAAASRSSSRGPAPRFVGQPRAPRPTLLVGGADSDCPEVARNNWTRRRRFSSGRGPRRVMAVAANFIRGLCR